MHKYLLVRIWAWLVCIKMICIFLCQMSFPMRCFHQHILNRTSSIFLNSSAEIKLVCLKNQLLMGRRKLWKSVCVFILVKTNSCSSRIFCCWLWWSLHCFIKICWFLCSLREMVAMNDKVWRAILSSGTSPFFLCRWWNNLKEERVLHHGFIRL